MTFGRAYVPYTSVGGTIRVPTMILQLIVWAFTEVDLHRSWMKLTVPAGSCGTHSLRGQATGPGPALVPKGTTSQAISPNTMFSKA